jgi:hypothetical protein
VTSCGGWQQLEVVADASRVCQLSCDVAGSRDATTPPSAMLIESKSNKSFSRRSFIRTTLSKNAKMTAAATTGSQVQGCQMGCFQTKNPNFGKFWRVLEWKRLVYSMSF